MTNKACADGPKAPISPTRCGSWCLAWGWVLSTYRPVWGCVFTVCAAIRRRPCRSTPDLIIRLEARRVSRHPQRYGYKPGYGVRAAVAVKPQHSAVWTAGPDVPEIFSLLSCAWALAERATTTTLPTPPVMRSSLVRNSPSWSSHAEELVVQEDVVIDRHVALVAEDAHLVANSHIVRNHRAGMPTGEDGEVLEIVDGVGPAARAPRRAHVAGDQVVGDRARREQRVDPSAGICADPATMLWLIVAEPSLRIRIPLVP